MSNEIKPGCFGSPTCHNPSSFCCKRCKFIEPCSIDAKARAERLRIKYGIDNYKGLVNATTKKPRIVSSKDKDSEKFAEIFSARGIDLKSSVVNKLNPFVKDKLPFMRIAIGSLLTTGSGLEQSQLETRYRKCLNYTDDAAKHYAKIAMNVMRISGAGVENNGKLFPRKRN